MASVPIPIPKGMHRLHFDVPKDVSLPYLAQVVTKAVGDYYATLPPDPKRDLWIQMAEGAAQIPVSPVAEQGCCESATRP